LRGRNPDRIHHRNYLFDIPTRLAKFRRTTQARSPETWTIGIDICEDEYLERGLGTEALRLWVDYLFANSTVHRIGLDTWSFNPRMVRVAEKLGFTPEGAQRQVLQWQNHWLDLIHYGMLRAEWEKRK
jgi:RimJ/RimL family protein N-acetyltransferase